MTARSTLALLPFAFVSLVMPAVASAQPAPAPPYASEPWAPDAAHGAESAPSISRSPLDPLLPMSVSTMALGGLVLLGGVGSVLDTSSDTAFVCGDSGCVEVEQEGDPTGEMLLAGGATMAAGGAALLVASMVAPASRASAGRARVAAGGMGLSLGAGTAVMGAIALSNDPDSPVAGALLGAGLVTSAISVPVLAWGVGTLDEGATGDVYESHGRIVAGSILTTAGIGLGTIGTAAIASAADCNGELCGFGVIAGSVPLVLGVACLATGIPLFVTGADVEPGITHPEVHVGAGDVQVSWRFQ